MKYTLILASIFVLAGCGSLSNNDVESEIEIDAPESITGETGLSGADQELFVPTQEGDRINLQEEIVDGSEQEETATEEILDATDDAVVLEEAPEEGTEEVVDVTPQVVETITNRVSPVTGPAIPEAEMRKILEAK